MKIWLARVAELRTQAAQASVPPQPPAGGQPLPSTPTPAQSPSAVSAPASSIYEMTGHAMPKTGRWYFEVKLDVGEMARRAETAIFMGVRVAGGGSTGGLETIRKRDVGRPPINIGIAVDLIEGKVYQRANGAWLSQPGSAGGLDVKLGRPTAIWISSSTALDDALQDHLVEINLGQKPFVYAMPDGYMAADPQGPTRAVALLIDFFLGRPDEP